MFLEKHQVLIEKNQDEKFFSRPSTLVTIARQPILMGMRIALPQSAS